MTSTRTAKLLASLLAISSLTLSCVPQPEADAGGGGGSRTASGGAGGGGNSPTGTGGGSAASGGSPGNAGGAPAGAGTGGAPSGGASGTGGGNASSGGSTGSGGALAAASDAGGMTNMPPMTPATGGGGDPWASCQGVTFKPGISAQDYCTKFMSACGFGGTDRFASMADCMTKYAGLSDGPTGGKACVAWHLCVAADPPNKDTFCPHGPQAAAMNGPCKPSYL